MCIRDRQQAILAAGDKAASNPLDWCDDGSVHVARGETTILSGRWIAETLRHAGPDVLYVATSEAATSDACLAAANYPRQGPVSYTHLDVYKRQIHH